MAVGQVRLDEDARKAIEDVQRIEREAGRPTLSEKQAANWLIRRGHKAVVAEEKRKAAKR
jgi:maleate cis-trans isomerase